MKINIVTAVWGETYAEGFLKVGLRSLVAPGNLPALAAAVDCTYSIETDRETADYLENQPAIARLREIMAVTIRPHRIEEGNVYTQVSKLHSVAVAEAYDRDAGLIFITPDMLLSGNTLSSVLKYAQEGMRVVYVCQPRLQRDTVLDRLAPAPGRFTALDLSGRDIVRLAMDAPHPMTRHCYWTAPQFCTWPHHIFFDAGDAGFIGHGFHVHPLLVIPERRTDLGPGTMDTLFPILACPDYAKVKVADDSDEIAVCEFSQLGIALEETAPQSQRMSLISYFFETAGNAYHLYNGATAVRFRTGQSPERLDRTASESADVYRKIYARARLNSFALLLIDPVNTYRRATRIQSPNEQVDLVAPGPLEHWFLGKVRAIGRHLLAIQARRDAGQRRLKKWELLIRALASPAFWGLSLLTVLGLLAGMPQAVRAISCPQRPSFPHPRKPG